MDVVSIQRAGKKRVGSGHGSTHGIGRWHVWSYLPVLPGPRKQARGGGGEGREGDERGGAEHSGPIQNLFLQSSQEREWVHADKLPGHGPQLAVEVKRDGNGHAVVEGGG